VFPSEKEGLGGGRRKQGSKRECGKEKITEQGGWGVPSGNVGHDSDSGWGLFRQWKKEGERGEMALLDQGGVKSQRGGRERPVARERGDEFLEGGTPRFTWPAAKEKERRRAWPASSWDHGGERRGFEHDIP